MNNRFWISLPAALLLAACATASGPAMTARRASVESGAGGAQPPIVADAGPRLLIRHADLGVEVEKLDPAEERVTSMARALGGYVENQADRSGGFNDGRRLTVRVPSPQLEAAIDSVERLGRVTSREVGAEDVTDQVVDLDARVTSLRATRDRLRQLLDRSASVADVVTVEKELSRVQAELDSLEARLTQARGQVAMARLSVNLHPKRVLGPVGLAFAGVGWILQKLFIIR